MATAFAAKDILGNVLSGLSMQFSKPFSLGDTIKVTQMSWYFSFSEGKGFSFFPILMDPNSFFIVTVHKKKRICFLYFLNAESAEVCISS